MGDCGEVLKGFVEACNIILLAIGRQGKPPHVISPALCVAKWLLLQLCSQQAGLGYEQLSSEMDKLVRSCHVLGGRQWSGWWGWG